MFVEKPVYILIFFFILDLKVGIKFLLLSLGSFMIVRIPLVDTLELSSLTLSMMTADNFIA